MIRALEEGIAHLQGRIKLRTRTIVIPDAVVSEAIDVHAIREKSGLSQSEFAARYGFSFRTLQEWEQGRARPDGAVRAYLTVIDRNPEAVQQALAS
jgi:putative transcriptional regulator